MKNKFLLVFLSTLLISSCGSNSNSESMIPSVDPTDAPTVIPTETPTEVPTETPTEVPTETPTEVPTVAPTETPSEEPTSKDENYYVQFSHVFSKDDFPNYKTGGSVTINNVNFDYTSIKYLQSTAKGVQIGSKNNPQLQPLTLHTSFTQKAVLTSYSLDLCVADSGKCEYNVTIGEHNNVGNVSKTNITTISEENLELPVNDINFSIKSIQRAFYLYSLSFTLLVDASENLNIHGDGGDAKPVVPGENSIPKTNFKSIDKDVYYSDIDLSVEGDALKQELRAKVSEMTPVSYDDAKYMLQYTDESTVKPGYLYGMYDGDDIFAKWDGGGMWNREHVWPCAKMRLISDTDFRPAAGTKNHTSDLHNLRAACSLVNGYHSDKYYSLENTSETMFPNVTSGLEGKHNYTGDFRGDVSRILFYMAIRYDGLKIIEDMTGADFKSIGVLSLAAQWNEEDPVDEFEIQRNNRIYEYQGNRNPFIDHPELINKLKNNVSA